ncbi:MAG TPA: hypothetical protein VLZ83_11195 [Edaphocola sp.]|nr:hypothetical protein [Edaphocola sp.]
MIIDDYYYLNHIFKDNSISIEIALMVLDVYNSDFYDKLSNFNDVEFQNNILINDADKNKIVKLLNNSKSLSDDNKSISTIDNVISKVNLSTNKTILEIKNEKFKIFFTILLVGSCFCFLYIFGQKNNRLTGKYCSKKNNRISSVFNLKKQYPHIIGVEQILKQDATFYYKTCDLEVEGIWTISITQDSLLLFCENYRIFGRTNDTNWLNCKSKFFWESFVILPSNNLVDTIKSEKNIAINLLTKCQ